MAEAPKKEESKIEGIKRNSRQLRGTIADTLQSPATHFAEGDEPLLKFHGIYQQDDRDVRHERRKAGQEDAFIFMARVAIPGGVVTPDQYLTLDTLGDTHANGSIRVTTRQGIQFHGVVKDKLKETIAGINHTLLTTISACGDVERNVMACPAPLGDEAHVTIRRVAREIAVQLRPASRAYYEIWLDEEKVVTTQDKEPFYGETYLPRKFKTGIALADDNCVDIYSYDAGLVAIVEGGKLIGYNVLVGGGMGMTHNKADTMAALAKPLGYVDAPHAVEAVRTICALFRDFGNRVSRRHARIKYLLADWGMEKFVEAYKERASFTLNPWRPTPPIVHHDHLGANRQENGKWFYGVYIENGRIIDREKVKIKTGLRKIVEKFRPGITFTPHQNLLFTDLDEKTMRTIEQMLVDHGMTPADELTQARRHSMACPALPTCGLAMSDSERAMPGVLDVLEAELTGLGMRDVPLTIRMTGCPNGCARPYTADIAFVGRKPEVYHVYVGGGLPGDRMADLYAADVEMKDIATTLRPLLSNWAARRHAGESLSDFYQRLFQRTSAREYITGKEEPTSKSIPLEILP